MQFEGYNNNYYIVRNAPVTKALLANWQYYGPMYHGYAFCAFKEMGLVLINEVLVV